MTLYHVPGCNMTPPLVPLKRESVTGQNRGNIAMNTATLVDWWQIVTVADRNSNNGKILL